MTFQWILGGVCESIQNLATPLFSLPVAASNFALNLQAWLPTGIPHIVER